MSKVLQSFKNIFSSIPKKLAKIYTTRTLVYGAICIALSFILSFITLYQNAQGGSVTAASMLPLFLFSYMFGVIPGMTAGLVYGLLQFIQYPVFLTPVQFILDYPLAFTMLGLAGIIRTKKYPLFGVIIGIVIACILRFVCHFFSGRIFFSQYAGNLNPWVYSLIYNSTVFIEMAICILVIIILFRMRLMERLWQRILPKN